MKKRRVAWLEAMPRPHGHYKLVVKAPPDDLPDDQYESWAAKARAEARRIGAKLITMKLGPLGRG